MSVVAHPQLIPATLQLAMRAHKGGCLAQAETAYRSILRTDPRNPDALNFLGMLRAQAGDLPAAADWLCKSTEADATNPHAWLNFGNVLLVSGQTDQACAAFRKSTQLAPELAKAWFNLGVCLGRSRHPVEAAAALRQALRLEPGHIPAYESLAAVLHRLGEHASAAEVYREWLALQPQSAIARHMLAATAGEAVPCRADAEFVRQVFDEFASSFDENLTALDYRAPQWLAERLARELPPGQRCDILDAGCGTGLSGLQLEPLARSLVGVDLSSAMLGKARLREIYDELVVGELSEFMRSRPSAFDVVAAADTLCYFGALEEPLAAAQRCLRARGILSFTLERLDPCRVGEPYHLETHGRYSHSADYTRTTLERAGFDQVSMDSKVLRRERDMEVVGHIVLARRA